MKIAFTTKGTTWEAAMDARFGRTAFIVLYDEQTNQLTYFDNKAAESEAHGAGAATAKQLFELRPDVLITGNGPGGNASAILQKLPMQIFTGAGEMTMKQAFEAYKNGKLALFN